MSMEVIPNKARTKLDQATSERTSFLALEASVRFSWLKKSQPKNSMQ